MHGAKWRGGKPTPIGYTAQRALVVGSSTHGVASRKSRPTSRFSRPTVARHPLAEVLLRAAFLAFSFGRAIHTRDARRCCSTNVDLGF